MFTRSNDLAPKELYYNDALLQKPTTADSALLNFTAGIATPVAMAGDIGNMLSQTPQGNPMRDFADSVQILDQTPGMSWTQESANSLSNMAGYMLNPISWGFGALGKVSAEAVGAGVSKVLPDAVSVFARTPIADLVNKPLSSYIPKATVGGEEVPLTTALLGQKYSEAFGTGVGAGVPQAWYDNYNADTKHIDWGGAADDLGKMGAYGLGIASIPFAWGVLKSRVGRGLGKDVADLTQRDYDTAFENGLITKDEHSWITDYNQNPLETPDLKERASAILSQNGVDVNTATHEVPFNILDNPTIQNLQSALTDESVNGFDADAKNALSTYIVHNGIDNLRDDPQALDGLRGFRDFIDQKIAAKPEKLAQADKMLDNNLTKGMTKEMPLSQNELIKTTKRAGINPKQVKHLPMTMPDNVARHLRQVDEINRLEKSNKDLFKKYEKTGDSVHTEKMRDNQARIDDLQGKLEPILEPKQELTHIREKLITEKDLKNKWDRSKEYHRLVDLSHVWENAKTLLDRVHLEAQYERQESYRNLADNILKMTDSDVGRFADRDSVVNYTRDRIASKTMNRSPILDVEAKAEAQKVVPANSDELINANELEVKQSDAKNLGKEYSVFANKYKEFKESANVFKNMLLCVKGARNG